MELGEKLQVIIDGQYDFFANSMAARGIDPSLALLVLDGMKVRLLESAYHNTLEAAAKAELEPAKTECHEGTVEDLKNAFVGQTE